MDISKGQVAAVAIIIAVLVQGLGGFLANAETQTSCVSQFDYLTDVFGSFDGTGQDIPVDFNPRENVTGYYAYDPTDEEQSKQIKRIPAIIYDPASTANNYPYLSQPEELMTYTITVKCTRDGTTEGWDRTPEHYEAVIIKHAETRDIEYRVDWDGSNDRNNPAWYSGVYHESVGHLTNSRISVYGNTYQAPRILNLMDFYTHIDQAAPVNGGDNAGSLLDGADLNLTVPGIGSQYPCFLADLTCIVDEDVFHKTIDLRYDSEVAPYAYYNRSVSTVEIHASNYPLNQAWFVFGSKEVGCEVTFEAVAHKSVSASTYIDPRTGVSPIHQASSYVEYYDEYYFPRTISGTLNYNGQGATMSAPLGQVFKYTAEFSITTVDPDDIIPGKETPVIDHVFASLTVEGDGSSTQSAVFNVTLKDLETGHTETHEWRSASRLLAIDCTWTASYDGIRVNFSERVLGGSVTLDMDPEWLPDGQEGNNVFWKAAYIPDEDGIEPPENPDTPLKLYAAITDEYDPYRLPDLVLHDYNGWEDFDTASVTAYQIEHKGRTLPFTSEATYWNNGYGNPDPSMGSGNGNALIGIVLTTEPKKDDDGRSMPTETPFNICMHYEDTANPGQYLNSWLYNDPLKKAVSVWTDTGTKMVYIGHYNEAGVRQDATAMQIGVCDHVYVELRVDKGNLSVWVAPIYEFASFLDYKASPLMDQTASVQGILPVDHPIYKSMAQLSYNVQPVGIGPYSLGETVQTWTSGGCIVTLDDEGNLTVNKRDGGDGAMLDYYPTPEWWRAPWLASYRDISRIIVMDGVTHIGNFAFYGLSNADGIKIQSTVTTIGSNAFAACWSVKQMEFAQTEWAITDIGIDAFDLGTTSHLASCTVSSPGNSAQGRLTAYGGEFTTFAYVDSYIYPDYPRQLVVKTIILLDGGGLYVQDGVFHPNLDYPNSPLAELVINAVVHPGGTVTLGTTDDGGRMTVLMTMENDGTDKWMTFKKGDGTILWEGQKFDWWDVHIFYVSNKIGAVDIEDVHYEGQMYLPDGTKLAQNHVYVKAGKYGETEDIGAMVQDEHGMSDLTVKMGGVWAFSTQFNNGTNIQGSHVVWGGSAWDWDMNATLTVFALTMLMASIVLFYKFGYNIYDILLLGGSLALLWVSFTG